MWPLEFLPTYTVWKPCKSFYGPQPQGSPRTSWNIGVMKAGGKP